MTGLTADPSPATSWCRRCRCCQATVLKQLGLLPDLPCVSGVEQAAKAADHAAVTAILAESAVDDDFKLAQVTGQAAGGLGRGRIVAARGCSVDVGRRLWGMGQAVAVPRRAQVMSAVAAVAICL